MQKIQKSVLAILCALVMVVGSVQFLAAQEPAMVTGELISVDADAGAITVRTEEGQEVQFRYTEETEVSGAQEGAAGLATMSGASVTVHFIYDEESNSNTATRIDVNQEG